MFRAVQLAFTIPEGMFSLPKKVWEKLIQREDIHGLGIDENDSNPRASRECR